MSKNSGQSRLIVLEGPTAVGKTAISIQLAQHFGCPIISADSRQIYQEMTIGTGKVSEKELNLVDHYFINSISVASPYSAGQFEKDAIQCLDQLFKLHSVVILTGGTGLFIKAVIEGLDNFPKVPKEITASLDKELEENGLAILQEELAQSDPDYFEQVDIHNHRRVLRALAIIRTTGKPFSSFLSSPKKLRPFRTTSIRLQIPRDVLYARINKRVDEMMQAGWLGEARDLLPFAHLPALQTVGYHQLFEHLKGQLDLQEAIDQIKVQTRRYAKRQETWLNKYSSGKIFHPDQYPAILAYIIKEIANE